MNPEASPLQVGLGKDQQQSGERTKRPGEIRSSDIEPDEALTRRGSSFLGMPTLDQEADDEASPLTIRKVDPRSEDAPPIDVFAGTDDDFYVHPLTAVPDYNGYGEPTDWRHIKQHEVDLSPERDETPRDAGVPRTPVIKPSEPRKAA